MLPKKWNSRTSPTAAVLESGLNEKPLWPVLMTIVFAATVAVRATRRGMNECIMLIFPTNASNVFDI